MVLMMMMMMMIYFNLLNETLFSAYTWSTRNLDKNNKGFHFKFIIQSYEHFATSPNQSVVTMQSNFEI